MCGIIGIIGSSEVAPIIVEGLKRLEYRGYDSAGIATINDHSIERRRAKGKLSNLSTLLKEKPLPGKTGIGHTRWATHGAPTETNAHPHATNRVAVVHNGIIENFQELRTELTASGRVLTSDTDTEVIVHIIDMYLTRGLSPQDATASALKRLEGAFALGIIFNSDESLMIGARRGSPLALGIGDNEMFLGSDAMALAPLTDLIIYLEDGDWAVLSNKNYVIYGQEAEKVQREVRQTEFTQAAVEKGGYKHFMLKEIWEQPQVIGDTLNALINPHTRAVNIPDLGFDLKSLTKLTLIACGTSYYACLVAKYWLEQVARIPVEVDIASEFRYRQGIMAEGGAALFVSQSGETIDTLAALRYARSYNQKILSIVNVPESAIARESDAVLQTYAGPEIGVASTKAFTTQLTVLACLTLALAHVRGEINNDERGRLVGALTEVPARIVEILNHNKYLSEIAASIAVARDVLYLGRGVSYPIALEGALKLKEISYIHAEGYAAGEMKHGPIALIDEEVPVVVVCPSDPLIDKTISNVQEVMARGGKVIFFSDATGTARLGSGAKHKLVLPFVDPFVSPILYAIPVQLLAYHVACLKGTDIDQPRNLAKSVTVE
ncbi:MAG: glutamine--fructose-6-phosphate transaminase (isomerizing) [Rhodospirillaceae bacterium TMED8]|nr:glutamine--fructose-6-phosphate transaminase (isomerizing) [Magnetovibrio sp.]OUT48534.1 MAG: glutamine--fructose-6-phosphate transaminase (isomerizing) [Rhodospirillaceae bacterium TMED8]